MGQVYGISLDTAQKHLNQWLEAELKVTAAQSYVIGNRSYTRADLKEIRKQIDYWRGIVQRMENAMRGGRNRMYSVVPRDW